jgi:hypothetical protein
MSVPTSPGWHLSEIALRDYTSGHTLPVAGASVEAHLVQCADCRARLGAVVPREALDRTWTKIRDAVETPHVSVTERLLRHLGMSAESARILAAVPAFRGAWLLGVFVVLVFAGVAALFSGDVGLSLFLIAAPLVPVAGVAACFGGDADPAHELITTTPHSAFRLLLLRTLGVLGTSIPLTAFIGIVLPGPAWLGAAWLLPAVAGVLLTLLVGPVLGSTSTAAALGACWSLAVVTADRVGSPLEVVEPLMQLVLAVVALGALAALLVRYPSFDRLGGQS